MSSPLSKLLRLTIHARLYQTHSSRPSKKKCEEKWWSGLTADTTVEGPDIAGLSRYAHLVVNVLRNAHVTVFLYSECVPTPLVAFGVRHLKCCCGVMITASHNPKQDNGFKLYWEYGAQETLTGFKWIGNTCNELSRKNNSVLFAYEEAIGYMCNPNIPDKDGISAAVLIAQLTGYLTAHQKNPFLSTLLERLYMKYGRHLTRNSYLRIPKSSSQMITFYFDHSLTPTLKASGTEPKIKFYIKIIGPPSQN
ncbi:phosphoglucomutase-2-like [Octopus sinensis]|uniref:Phosphoglucomutase-2-like n=1 Tax=Octopus sinensis TaxID=2607531 RepID=A0A6P7U3P6_9MOLL|nr:phosphoglucomutase-2-like [Octopus sinensis]